jgi:hypothetical protein
MKKLLIVLALFAVASASPAADKKIIFIAGKQSHGPLAHEHRAGSLLLAKCLQGFPGVITEVHTNGWVSDEKAIEGAAAVVVYSDGGGGHPLLREDHLEKMGALMKKGVGLACLHYATEPTPDKGEKEFLEWLGGAFSPNWSVNPHWDADFVKLPSHPITRGVKPFMTNDEWYFHLRWADGMKGVTPILTAIAPESTMSRPDGHHSGNPTVRESVKRGDPQHVAWAMERPDGGRGFGFTGGHNHLGWGHEDQRRLVLNAILWVAKVEVPKGGVESKVTQDELMKNLDPKPAPRPKAATKKDAEKK